MGEAETKPKREADGGYLAESRSFALAAVSILPLVFVYHWGIIQSGYGERNLAEAWLVGPLRLVGLEAAHVLNVALVIALLAVLASLLDERASGIAFSIDWRAHAPLCLALGAGAYEELLFRLLLIGGGALLLGKVFLWGRQASVGVMLVISSLLFAAAHHVGPLGEPFESYSFLYRAVCGLLLGVVFLTRGLGVAAWTHAVYNALVLAQQAGA